MWIIYRIIVLTIVTGLVYYSAWSDPAANTTGTLIMTLVALLVGGTGLFIDKIFKKSDSSFMLHIAIGVFVGSITGYLFDYFVDTLGVQIPGLNQLVFLLPVVYFAFIGSRFSGYSTQGKSTESHPEFESKGSRAKLLDTSVIIDGRILDIAETHFIDGPFIIPNFVLREIQLISDSSDPIKRNRGRRGLEMLNKLQESKNLEVKISYLDYTDTREVDQKLVKASLETGAQLVTNDFNLNQVASLQGVQVLNLNNLTTALKPVVLPGEDIIIEIIKEGKDDNQGIGYLEDGTMVVVENGGKLQGKKVRVNVTSIIQTAAGKMIFTRSEGVVEDSSEPSESVNGSNRDRGKGDGNRGGSRRSNRSKNQSGNRNPRN